MGTERSYAGNGQRKNRKLNRQRVKMMQIIAICALGVLVLLAAILLLTGGESAPPDDQLQAGADAGDPTPEPDESGKFKKGVVVAGIDLSGLTLAEGRNKLSGVAEPPSDYALTLKGGEGEYTLTAADLGMTADVDAALTKALQSGAGAGELSLAYTVNESAVRAKLDEIAAEVNQPPVNASMKLKSDPSSAHKPSASDVFDYIEGQDGLTVDIDATLAAIEAQVESSGSAPVELTMKVTPPEVTLADVQKITSRITTFSTEYKGKTLGKKERVKNIEKGIKMLSGAVIQPGDEWSFNKFIGPRTTEGGWAEAPGIVNGNQYEMQAGGGICQVSTTLYNAFIRAELEIVESKHHSWPSSYVDYGLDATVSTGGPDLIIRNDKAHPVYIYATTDSSENVCYISIFGPPLEHGYSLNFYSKIVEELEPAAMDIIEDDSMEAGKEKTVVNERKGYRVEMFKQYLDKDGKVVKEEKFGKYKYSAIQGSKRVGTKKVSVDIPME